MELTKEELATIARKAEYDPRYFEKLYDYFFPKVYNYIYFKVNNEALAEDLVADIFVKVLNNISSCKNKTQFQSWLFTIARNHLIDFYRKKSKNIESQSFEEDYEDFYFTSHEDRNNSNNPEKALIDKVDREEIYKMIKKLSSQQQDVIVLRFFQELKLKEIAEVMNKNEGAIKGLLYRGIKALTQELERKGVIS